MKRLLQFHRRLALHGAETPTEWLLFTILLPFSLLYGIVGWIRGKCYYWGLLGSYRAPVPVVSVGNLAAGGTGKTPVVDWLVKDFIRQGKRPAVVSRGYGGSYREPVGIVSRGQGVLLGAGEAGDEPCLLALKNPQTPVLVARKRADGVKVAVEQFAADVVILDDGFQHRAVQRDLDLVLLDATRPYANGWPLPAGLLREFPVALKRADLLLLTRTKEGSFFSWDEKPVFKSNHQLSNFAVTLEGQRVPLVQLKTKKLLAFAGIADPESFFSAMSGIGLQVVGQLGLGDHCSYDQSLLENIMSIAEGCDALITTEKDAVKLKESMFSIPCYQMPMAVKIGNEAVFSAEIKQRLWR